jgi:hypothetical protein
MYKGDVIYHSKAPHISYVTTVLTFMLVFIWSIERGTKQLMHLETAKHRSTFQGERKK